MRCFYHPDYYFPVPEEHPFPMDKYWRTEALVRAECAFARIELIEPASLEQVLRVHTAEYLESIRTGTLPHPAVVKLGLPPCERLLTRGRLGSAGTIAAMNAALADGLACNLAGGTHHAFPDRGLGYCVLNDVAIAIRELHSGVGRGRLTPPLVATDGSFAAEPGDPALQLTRPPARMPLADRSRARVFVIDTDAHQGNGTNGIFAGDDRVFTFSIHVGRNYPAEKTPGSLDVELPRDVSGAEYLERLAATLAPAFDQFAPDFAFWISGADAHENDRFGQMKLTDADMGARDQHVLELVTSRRVPCAVLLGGGYNRDRLHTARLHANSILRTAAFWQSIGNRKSKLQAPTAKLQ